MRKCGWHEDFSAFSMTKDWIRDWPFKWFAPLMPDECAPSDPHWNLFLDPTWNYPRRRDLAGYLDNSPVAIVATGPEGYCFFCGCPTGNASAWFSDGEWIWPTGIGHCILWHNLRLPDSFVAHIESMNFVPPDKYLTPDKELPWPTRADLSHFQLR
jgi:hypothetical protein